MDNVSDVKIKLPQQLREKDIKISRERKARKDTTNIVLENDFIRVMIDYKNGGKICSFRSKDTDSEYFYRDPRKIFFPEKGYSYHDISGFDECFPTVAPSEYTINGRKLSMDDHGFLWQKPWNVDIKAKGDEVIMFFDVPQLGCNFQRKCSVHKYFLKLDYTITNYGKFSFPYIYSAHPLLDISASSRLSLSEEVKKIYVYTSSDNIGLNNTWIDMQVFKCLEEDFLRGNFLSDRKSFIKIFTDKLTQNEATIHYSGNKGCLNIEFDKSELPYLGIFIGETFEALDSADSERKLILGVEPTTGIGDDFVACKSTSTIKMLESGGEVRFWIKFSCNTKRNF